MFKKLNILAVVVLSLFISSCVSSNEKNDINDTGSLNFIICEDPRPQLCTREYSPVCAAYKDNNTKTSPAGCTACSDFNVIGYKLGEC